MWLGVGWGRLQRGGGGGGAVGFWLKTKSGGREGGGGPLGFWPDTKSGGGRGGYDRVSGGPGYSTVVEFMRADINRQRNRAAIESYVSNSHIGFDPDYECH